MTQQLQGSGSSFPVRFGRYRIDRILGEGGMGTVYLAQDESLERWVALKFPHFSPADGEAPLERFYREAKAAAKLPPHPNLCPVYEVGENNGQHFLAMLYIEGRTLDSVLRARKQLALAEAADLTRKLALALQIIHNHNLIHRDLKPSNVMIKPDGEPVVTDFGLARPEKGPSRLTRLGAVIGTPYYMSPEQAEGIPNITASTDIYSLGVILFEMLTGQVPFRGPNVSAIRSFIKHQEPPAPSSLRRDLDRYLQAYCLKALAKKPEHRFASMTEFASTLQVYLQRVHGRTQSQGIATALLAAVHPGTAPATPARPGTITASIPGPATQTHARQPAATGFEETALAENLSTATSRRSISPRQPRSSGFKWLVILAGGGVVLTGGMLLLCVGLFFWKTPTIRKTTTVVQKKDRKPTTRKESRVTPKPEVTLTSFPDRKVILNKDFTNPKTRYFGIEDSGWVTSGYRDGAYFIKEMPGGTWWPGMPGASDFACEYTLRVLEPYTGACGLNLHMEHDGTIRGVQIPIDGRGQMRVEPWVFDCGPPRPAYAGSIKHPAIKKNGEWNTVQILVRSQHLDLFVNGQRVHPTIDLELDFTPCGLGFQTLGGPEGLHTEIRQIKLWGLRGNLDDDYNRPPANPNDWRDRFVAARHFQDWNTVIRAAKELDKVGGVNTLPLWIRGHIYIRRGDLEKAAADWKRVMAVYDRQRGPLRGPDDLRALPLNRRGSYAALLFLLGHKSEAQAVCKQLLTYPCKPRKHFRPHAITRACVLSPDATTEWDVVVNLAKQAVSNARDPVTYQQTLGLVHYRRGEYKEALPHLEAVSKSAKSLRYTPVVSWFALALVQHQLGDPTAAKRQLALAQRWFDRTAPTLRGHDRTPLPVPAYDWLLAQLLRKEAEQLILKR